MSVGEEVREWKTAILIMGSLLIVLALGHRLGLIDAEKAAAAPDCTCHCECSEGGDEHDR